MTNRDFWCSLQTHGTYSLGFNAIMHWNDLGAGKASIMSASNARPVRLASE